MHSSRPERHQAEVRRFWEQVWIGQRNSGHHLPIFRLALLWLKHLADEFQASDAIRRQYISKNLRLPICCNWRQQPKHGMFALDWGCTVSEFEPIRKQAIQGDPASYPNAVTQSRSLLSSHCQLLVCARRQTGSQQSHKQRRDAATWWRT